MDYEEFYRPKKRRRPYSREEKANLGRLALFCAGMMLLGVMAGLIYIKWAGWVRK